MPADNISVGEPREFIRDIDNVFKLLQPTHVYLTPTAPESEAENAWPLERVMLVWKDEADVWHFKMQLLGEQHQGAFDTSIEDDQRIVNYFNALNINLDASEEISEDLSPDLLVRIVRPCLRLSLHQQNCIIAGLYGAWPLEDERSYESPIQVCLALLCGDRENLSEDEAGLVEEFSPFLTLDKVNGLAGNPGAANRFCETNNSITSGDVLKFIQFLLQASIKHIGHDEPVVLPAPPEGSERRYGIGPREVEITPEAMVSFEMALTALEASVPNLSEDDRQRLTQSLTALRTAKTTWFNSNKDINHLLTFRRATDRVLRAEHIQRLYTHQRYPRLGMFSDYVASPETPALQQLQLCLRELRDFSQLRTKCSKTMGALRQYLLIMMLGLCAVHLLVCIGCLSVMPLLALPIEALFVTSSLYGFYLTEFLFDTILSACCSEFSFDLWTAMIEFCREFITEDFPRALGAALVISAGYGLIAGELSAATGVLAAAGMIFASSFLISSAICIGVCIGVCIVAAAVLTGYLMADMISDYFEGWSYGFNPDEPVHDEVEGTGLAPT